jgi:hypothetical protein
MCNSTEQLSWAFDQYYKSQNSAASSCNFAGSATLQQSVAASGSCASLINQAGAQGTGTVTSSGSASSGTKKSDAAGVVTPGFDFGVLAMGFYVTVLSVFGAGVVLL